MMLRNLFTYLFSFFLAFTFAQNKEISTYVHGTFKHDNLERKFIYYAPYNLKSEAPLLVVLHGFTSSAEKIMNYSKFNQVADKHGFAVLYPQGTKDSDDKTFWNVGYSFHKNSKIDDVDFIAELTNHIQEKHQLSKNNTFLTGMSNGGEMCYLMQCQKPELFEAIAPVAGMMLTSFFDECSTRSTPVFAIFGTNDDITNYNGDPENKDGWGAYISIPKTIDFWANKIDFNQKTVDLLQDSNKKDGSYVENTSYLNTSNKHKVQFYKVINGGHDWPGSWGNQDIQASEEIWKFFKEYLE